MRDKDRGRRPGYQGLCVKIIVCKIQTMVFLVETEVHGTLLIFLKQNPFAIKQNKSASLRSKWPESITNKYCKTKFVVESKTEEWNPSRFVLRFLGGIHGIQKAESRTPVIFY